MQSPIDLPTELPASQYIYESSKDSFNKMYSDLKTNIQVVWNGHTSQIGTQKTDEKLQQYFDSNFISDTFGGNERFEGL